MQKLHCSYARGFTLLDLLITLAVLSMLLMTAVPALGDFVERQQVQAVSQSLAGQMRAARELAVTAGKKVIVCGSRDGSQCLKEDFEKILVFADDNHNYRRDPEELQLAVRQFKSPSINLRLAVSLGHPYLQYTPEGNANPYGSFLLCPRHSGKRQLLQRVSTNPAGRAYIAPINKSFGEVRMADDSEIVCH